MSFFLIIWSDLRQDMLTLQLIKIMDRIWQNEGLDLGWVETLWRLSCSFVYGMLSVKGQKWCCLASFFSFICYLTLVNIVYHFKQWADSMPVFFFFFAFLHGYLDDFPFAIIITRCNVKLLPDSNARFYVNWLVDHKLHCLIRSQMFRFLV